MSVNNFEITAIDAERFGEQGEMQENMRIDHNSSVTKIKKVKKGASRISFRFTANYSSMGRIEIEGRLVYTGGPSDLASKWRKSNDMQNKVANEIHSAIISNCIPQAVLISREVQLPPPIPLPEVNIPDEDQSKQNRTGGMEVR